MLESKKNPFQDKPSALKSFSTRHIGLRDNERDQMLEDLGFLNYDDFIKKVVPKDILSVDPLSLNEGFSINEANRVNVQNQFQLTSQAQAFLWQELRDQADFDFRAVENEENRKATIIATALANEGEAGQNYDDYLATLISSISTSYNQGLGGT